MEINTEKINHVKVNLTLNHEEFQMMMRVFSSNVTVPDNWYNEDVEPEKYRKLQNFMNEILAVLRDVV